MGQSEKRLQTLGTSCHLVVNSDEGSAQDLIELASDELARLEEKFSSYEADSVTSQINRAAGTGSLTPIDAETQSLFNYISVLWKESDQRFDPTVRLLQDCYDSHGALMANEQQLHNMLKLVGWSNLQISDGGAHLQNKGMLIDLNSCIRPYAVDCVMKILRKNGAGNALVEMDHDVATLGKQADGANWLTGMRFPKGARTGITRIKLNNRGFAVRGDFERSVIVDDQRYGRAISPADGHAIPGLLSVAVIADNCLTACSAASVARVMEEQAGLQWLQDLGFDWLAIDRQLNCHGSLAP